MQKRFFSLFFCIVGTLFWANAQNVDVKGIVKEKETGLPVAGANVYLKNTDFGLTSDREGVFEFQQVPQGSYTIEVSFVGFEKEKSTVVVKQGMPVFVFELKKSNTLLGGVEISASYLRKTESALKLPAPLKDIPVTTSSVTNELIEQTQVRSVHEALKYSTGIKPMINYGGFQTFVMRGFGAPVIMLDGARDERMNFSNSAPLTSLASVERIEYLKGPASVLYGHSAVGGIINVVRKQPSENFQGNFSATYGTWDAKSVTLGVGNRITEKLRYRFDAGLSEQKGWRDSGDKTANAYLALNYDVDDRNKLEFRLGANNDFYGTETGLPAVKNEICNQDGELLYRKGDLPDNFDREQRYNDPSDFLDHENVNGSLKYERRFSDGSKIQLHTSYSDDLIDYFSTEELSYLTSDAPIYTDYFLDGDKKIYICLDTLQRTYPLRFSHETKTFQNEVDFSTKLKTGFLEHKINAGYFFMYVDRKSFKAYDLGEDVAGPGLFAKISVVGPVLNQGNLSTGFSAVSIYHEAVNGLYVQDLIDISQKLKGLAGVRYDHYHMGYQSGNVESGRNITEKSKENTIVNNSVTYRLGIVYELFEPLSVYGSYSTFFKPKRSVYDENYIYLNRSGERFYPSDGNEVYKPEDGYQLELGLKYQYMSKLHLNASAYYIKKNNIVEYLGESGEGKRIYGQVGVVDSRGFDVEAVCKAFQSLHFKAGYGYNVAKYREFSNNDYSNSEEGNYVTNNPENHMFVWAYYQRAAGVLKDFNLGLGADYTDEMYTNSSNTYRLSGYWLFDAVAGYSFDKTYLKLKINNVFDKKYYSGSVYSNQYIPGYERNVMLTLGAKL